MEGKKEIIGIVLIKNEELFIVNILRNIVGFCDKIIVADNCSTDDTAANVHRFQRSNPKVEYHKIKKTRFSHDLIKEYAGDDVWIFGVDGDELYDPQGLASLRGMIMEGRFNDYWMVLGNVLNCVELDTEKKIASGYLAPPCRSMTKLYNFLAIDRWGGDCSERLHGGEIVFRPGFDSKKRYYLHDDYDWEKSIFRCLHLCFLPRSKLDTPKNGQLNIRKNIADKLAENCWSRVKSIGYRVLGRNQGSSWKKEKYMRGNNVKKEIYDFFP